MDLIDRQELLTELDRYIDAHQGHGFENVRVILRGLKREIIDFPCAQPEITHCAECIHWKHSDVRKSYCEVFDWVNTAEDFCSFAERRTDE